MKTRFAGFFFMLLFAANLNGATTVPYATSNPTPKPGDTFTTKAPTRGEVHALGLSRSIESKKFIEMHAKKAEESRADNPIPGTYDLTSKVSPPENQGNCGSCWDFSLTKALRSALMLAGKDPGTLAFNYLLNNCGPGPHMYGCGGGDFDAGQSFLNGAGPWLDSQDHYTQSEGRCKSGLNVAGTAIDMQVISNQPSFKVIAGLNSQNKMLAVDVAVAGAWGAYSSGIYNRNDAGPGSINHMINVVGYSCETSVDASGNCVFDANGKPKNGDGYLKAENNWDVTWGEGGYMRTRWGMNAIGNTIAYFTVKEVPPPTPPVPPTPPTPPTPEPGGAPLYLWVVIGALVVGILVLVVIKK